MHVKADLRDIWTARIRFACALDIRPHVDLVAGHAHIVFHHVGLNVVVAMETSFHVAAFIAAIKQQLPANVPLLRLRRYTIFGYLMKKGATAPFRYKY